jgi:hypothetical protein
MALTKDQLDLLRSLAGGREMPVRERQPAPLVDAPVVERLIEPAHLGAGDDVLAD